MEEDDEIVKKVNKTNTEFYRAFENLSIEMMDNLWKHWRKRYLYSSRLGFIYWLVGRTRKLDNNICQYRDDKVHNYKYKNKNI
jgi:hypothetical protein